MRLMMKTWLVVILLMFGGVIAGLFVLLGGKFGLPTLESQTDLIGLAIALGSLHFMCMLFSIAISGRKESGAFACGFLGLLFGVLGATIVACMPGKQPELPSKVAATGRAR
ncbi:MAG: hypothetical protein AB7K09_00980 [Planctomycetota bacterium]